MIFCIRCSNWPTASTICKMMEMVNISSYCLAVNNTNQNGAMALATVFIGKCMGTSSACLFLDASTDCIFSKVRRSSSSINFSSCCCRFSLVSLSCKERTRALVSRQGAVAGGSTSGTYLQKLRMLLFQLLPQVCHLLISKAEVLSDQLQSSV